MAAHKKSDWLNSDSCESINNLVKLWLLINLEHAAVQFLTGDVSRKRERMKERKMDGKKEKKKGRGVSGYSGLRGDLKSFPQSSSSFFPTNFLSISTLLSDKGKNTVLNKDRKSEYVELFPRPSLEHVFFFNQKKKILCVFARNVHFGLF